MLMMTHNHQGLLHDTQRADLSQYLGATSEAARAATIPARCHLALL